MIALLLSELGPWLTVLLLSELELHAVGNGLAKPLANLPRHHDMLLACCAAVGEVPGYNLPPVSPIGYTDVAAGTIGYSPPNTPHTWKG